MDKRGFGGRTYVDDSTEDIKQTINRWSALLSP